MQRKLAFAYILVALALFVLIGVIAWIIFWRGDSYSRTVLNQQTVNSSVIPFRRGTIMDRNQTVLAASEQVYNLILDPSVLLQSSEEDQAATVTALVTVFGYTEEEMRQVLSDNSASAYVRYEKELSEDKKTAFDNYRTEYNANKENIGKVSSTGVWFESEYKRVYPYDSLACTVLGFSGSDSSQGNWGIEQYYNDYLVGTNGRSYGYLNSDGVIERTTKSAEDGATIITTIDYTVQRIVENAITDFVADKTVDNVGVLVMDPKTAEILALATDSSFDLNNPSDLSGLYTEEELAEMSDQQISDTLNSLWRNFAISDTYEPGSTAKVFTEAAALEEDLAEADTTYDCDGGEQVVDRYIRCSHTHHEVTFVEALGKSCNDAMMQMAKLMGKSVFCKYQNLFGFGRTTGIDLPGEASGILYSEDKMSSVDLATNAFGQNFTCTMVQMAAAYCSILNGGSYYKPHIVKEILSANGDIIEEVGNTVVRETVSQSAAEVLLDGLAMVVSDGTAKNAVIQGYTVGGKTGTAEKYPRGNENYVLSFVGFTPVEDPELLVYVVVDNPHSKEVPKYTVKDTAVPLEQKIMRSLLDYLNITPASAFDPDAEAPREPETDAEGNIIDDIVLPAARDEENDEIAPDGGYIEGEDDGPPTEEPTDENGQVITDEEQDQADGEDAEAGGEAAEEGEDSEEGGDNDAEGEAGEAGGGQDAGDEDGENAGDGEEGDDEDGEAGGGEAAEAGEADAEGDE